MNICGYNKNARVARRKFGVMGGDQGSHGGGHRIFGMGGGQPFMGGDKVWMGGGPGASGGTMGTPAINFVVLIAMSVESFLIALTSFMGRAWTWMHSLANAATAVI